MKVKANFNKPEMIAEPVNKYQQLADYMFFEDNNNEKVMLEIMFDKEVFFILYFSNNLYNSNKKSN